MTDELVARAGVDRLLASYALLLDVGDHAACADLFLEDGELVISDRTVEGRAALLGFFEHSPAGVHLPGATLVDLASNAMSAAVRQSFFFVANGSNVVVRGVYRDLVALAGDRWRFRRREIEMYPGPA